MQRFLLLATLLTLPLAASAQFRVARNGQPLTTILTQPGATPAELHAAQDLQQALTKITGVEIPLQQEATKETPNAIVVGQGPLAQKLLPNQNWQALKEEQTLIAPAGQTLVVAGGRPRGTLYAVTRLLTRLGVRYWTPWATDYPHTPNLTLNPKTQSETPAYEYRDPYWFHSFDADWAAHNFDNGSNTRVDEAHGGRIEYQGFVHTYYPLVPPATLFAAHPEWYSLINGKRVDHNAQLCTTNPELRDYVVSQVRTWLQQNPKARIVSVSQNDCFQPCQCDNCRALVKRQGSESALVLDLVNYVAEKLEPEFPQVAFDTLAYQWSRKPPLDMRPRKNVIVRLCSIECNFAFPLNAPANQSFADDVAGWSKLTNRLYIWDYCTNFANYLAPQPDYFTFGETLKFLYNHGARGIFEEGAYQSTGADMAELKAWVMSQLFWNPYQNEDALVKQFLRGYYGKAADPIYRYLKFIEQQAQKGPLGFAARIDNKFLNYQNMRQAELLWQKAEANVAKDPTTLWRVKQSHLSVQFVFIKRWQEFKKAVTPTTPWPITPSRKAFAQAWLTTATQPGPTNWTPVNALTEGGGTPQSLIATLGPDPAEPTTK